MAREVNVSICLYYHHGHFEGYEKDVRIIKATSIDKGMPLTHFISGIQLDEMQKHRATLHEKTWFDIVDLIRNSNRFINPRFGDNDPYKSELGIMPYNHIPLVHPFAPQIWGIYFDGILKDQILWSKRIAEQHFGITPVSIHPPDGIYSPAAAHTLRQCGLDTVVISSEYMWNPHDKGLLYWASDLRHVVRTNDVQLQHFWDAREFVNRVVDYANQHDLHFVTVGLDSDSIPIDSLIPRLCCIADEAYKRGVKLININAAANWNMWQDNIERVWGNWDNVWAMMNKEGVWIL